MKKLLYICCFIGVIITQSGCRREATVEAPNTEPLPVMFSFLSPDASDLRVTLTMSKPVFTSIGSDEFPPISVAQVIISDQTGFVDTFTYDANREYYVLDQSEFPIKPGFTYTVSAKWDKYNVKGVTTIPSEVPSFDSLGAQKAGQTSWGATQYQISFKWNDFAGKNNYYRVVLEQVYFPSMGDTMSSSYGDKVFSDKNRDGAILSDRMDYYYDDFGGPLTDIWIYLLHTDIHYYEFHRRRINYFGDDPFSEPSPQYSNVTGGLGVVASYRKATFKVVI